MDKLNKGILRQLQDGRKSYKNIAEELEVTENTVRSRVRRMEEMGILDISGHVDADKVEDLQIIMIGIRTSSMDYIAKGEEISNLPGVISVAVVTGRFDLIVTVELADDRQMLDFLKNELSAVDSIEAIETFVIYKGFNLKVPYLQ
ncbi:MULTISPECIES: Lrp/AsnC family transcriptional regulator [unclassified Oceanispirochaeta]|uniref:Lrp/AsnC family transcriptional regulator n=1 Tax=unclassified Oceanispirochaeta TaxID=2635722 RepID=UPI000E0956A2|nr:MULTISPECIES: Lrp/AsnC family transcriptional regulator [unclassified Oceanispirochaeta]MBF9015547.1 Lrp/AsnC family transcriptional regulator [Oceanispirochaeta sp. M2]NPD73964.1 Lrp/AsnC family transcriptional regulator [Oceanispirochaeta sp. M1]RDG30274.1 Lrp/AsnC family transcriptional regulator [Oceanispirochaeta sp. M1]